MKIVSLQNIFGDDVIFNHICSFVVELTGQHFRSDPVQGSYQVAGGSGSYAREDRGYDRQRREPRRDLRNKRNHRNEEPAAFDEEEEVRRAIELSKVSAQREEEERLKELAAAEGRLNKQKKKESKHNEDGDFDFGSGFEKFATGQNGDNEAVGGDNLDDFDFNDDKDKKGGEDFNFNFGAEEQKKDEKAGGVGDLLDLDFGSSSAPTDNQPAQ